MARYFVRIALTIAALNGLRIFSCDIQKAYLTAECQERIYTIAGLEFQSDARKFMIVKIALYGLKSSGAVFWSKLLSVIWELGYRPSKADIDVWLRPAVKPDDFRYYQLILCYVDDIISISPNQLDAISGIQKVFKLKNTEMPTMYLGGGVAKVKTNLGKECWTFLSDKYIKAAVRHV